MKKTVLFLSIMLLPYLADLEAARWKDWELGGDLGLGYAAGSKSGKILCPAVKATVTKVLDTRMIEIGVGYLYGSETEKNYTVKDAEYYDQEIIDAAESDVKVRLSVIPMTVNFFYNIYTHFYVGGGVGFYHVFYKREPLGEYGVAPDSEPGVIEKAPATTALGFQQMAGVEIFPMSDNWSWFAGFQSFFTTSATRTGGMMGLTLGGRVRYSW
ncbi:MAG: hypothetical protein JXJ19_04095 [Elusimicrobia bacterium]|nr:hypothetical protein [Elusimicrobiota bacterium]